MHLEEYVLPMLLKLLNFEFKIYNELHVFVKKPFEIVLRFVFFVGQASPQNLGSKL